MLEVVNRIAIDHLGLQVFMYASSAIVRFCDIFFD